jgi:hypothetical protein
MHERIAVSLLSSGVRVSSKHLHQMSQKLFSAAVGIEHLKKESIVSRHSMQLSYLPKLLPFRNEMGSNDVWKKFSSGLIDD